MSGYLRRHDWPAYVAFLFTVVVGTAVLWVFIGYLAPDHHAAPAPAVTVVTLANGQRVNCVTVGQAVSCDWTQFRGKP